MCDKIFCSQEDDQLKKMIKITFNEYQGKQRTTHCDIMLIIEKGLRKVQRNDGKLAMRLKS